MKPKGLLILAFLPVLLSGCALLTKSTADDPADSSIDLGSCLETCLVISIVFVTITGLILLPLGLRTYKKKKRLNVLLGRLRQKYRESLKTRVGESERQTSLALGEECLSILKSVSAKEWESFQVDAVKIRRELKRMLMFFKTIPVAAPVPAMSEEIERLALLRKQGVISDREFAAFSERFTVSSTEKARGILEIISSLHEQWKSGALTEGNYRDAIWSLLNELERKTYRDISRR